MLDFLKNPNVDIGIILFYLFFIVIIPTLLLIYTNYLKFYMPLMIAFANMLTNSMSPLLFKNLYDLKSNDPLTIISTHFIILYSFIGLYWLTIEYSQTGVRLPTAIIYGILLYVLAYILANEPMLFIINKISDKLDSRMDNWARLIIGAVYVIILFILVVLVSKLTNIADKRIGTMQLGTMQLGTMQLAKSNKSNNNVRKDFSLTSVKSLFK
jgi:apolipoprotein N-acyltransferase